MSYYTRFFIKPKKTALLRSWQGMLIADWNGNIIGSTLPSSVSASDRELAVRTVMFILRQSNARSLQFGEINVYYEMLRLRIAFSASRIQLAFIKRRTADDPELELELESGEEPLEGEALQPAKNTPGR